MSLRIFYSRVVIIVCLNLINFFNFTVSTDTKLGKDIFNQPTEFNIVTTPEDLLDIMKTKNKFVLEIYSPWCVHCQNLAPILEEIAIHYKPLGVDFYRLDGSDLGKWSHIIKIKFYPMLFIVDSTEFIQYQGGLEKLSIETFINKVYFFKCLENPDETQFLENFKDEKPFLIGFFKKQDIKQLFHDYSNKIKPLIQQCFIFEEEDKFITSVSKVQKLRGYNFSNNDNFVISYNMKKVRLFEGFIDFSNLIFHTNELNDSRADIYNKLEDNYLRFIKVSHVPAYFDFEIADEFLYFGRNVTHYIFTYRNSQEKIKQISNIEQVLFLLGDDPDRHVYLYDSSISDRFFYRFDLSGMNGFHMVNYNLDDIKTIEKYDLHELIDFIHKSSDELKKSSTKEVDLTKYKTAKIVYKKQNETKSDGAAQSESKGELEKLEDKARKESPSNETAKSPSLTYPKNDSRGLDFINKVFVYSVYFIAYSVIFYFFYSRYLQEGETKVN